AVGPQVGAERKRARQAEPSAAADRRGSIGIRGPWLTGAPPLMHGFFRGGRSGRIAMKIVVIGGSGLIGKKVVTNLRRRGHEVAAASPSSGVNTVTGEGLAQALAGARVVVDVANAPSWEDNAVLAFFET